MSIIEAIHESANANNEQISVDFDGSYHDFKWENSRLTTSATKDLSFYPHAHNALQKTVTLSGVYQKHPWTVIAKLAS